MIAFGKNILLLFTTLIFCFAFMEFTVFRHFIHVSELPAYAFENGVIKYKPNQTGKYFVDTYTSEYRMNAQGWNSKYQQYLLAKSDKLRIAVIGDSFVEALQVNYDRSLAERLEKLIGSDNAEVYRFGINAAPMSGYLHILRQEVVRYNPDIVIVVLIHNDFMESYEMKPGRNSSSFLKLKVVDGERIQEIPPAPYREGFLEYITRVSATLRFVRKSFNVQSRIFLETFFFADVRQTQPTKYQANIDMSKISAKRETNIRATEYIFQEFAKLQTLHHFKILLLMDGDRLRGDAKQNMYQGKVTSELQYDGALSLNLLASEAAHKYALPFVDLHPVFASNFRLQNKRFEYQDDTHWNEYGHQVVARTVYDYMRDHGWLPNRQAASRHP